MNDTQSQERNCSRCGKTGAHVSLCDYCHAFCCTTSASCHPKHSPHNREERLPVKGKRL